MGSLHVSTPARRDHLWLLNALAIALLTLLGAAGEALGYDRHLIQHHLFRSLRAALRASHPTEFFASPRGVRPPHRLRFCDDLPLYRQSEIYARAGALQRRSPLQGLRTHPLQKSISCQTIKMWTL